MSGSGGDRRPLVVLFCLALVAVAVFVTGAVGVAGGHEGGGTPWMPKVPLGGALGADDLQVESGSCAVEGTTITFTGGCALKVVPVVGGWPWSDVTRRARLVVDTGSVNVAATVMGKRIDADLGSGEDVRLVFTRDGGDLVLGCLAIGGCKVVLAEDTVP